MKRASNAMARKDAELDEQRLRRPPHQVTDESLALSAEQGYRTVRKICDELEDRHVSRSA